MAKEDRGFASMDRGKQREIASKGGKAAHQKGTAHEWTSEEAREAGRKGGMASHRRKQGEGMGEESAETNQGMEMSRASGDGADDSMERDDSMTYDSESTPRGTGGRGNSGDDDMR